MARGQKSLGLVGLAGLLIAVLVIVPLVKIYFPGVFVSEGFINVRCEKTTCPEGTFCEKAYNGGESCVPIYVGKQ
jgi:hypothetical protein